MALLIRSLRGVVARAIQPPLSQRIPMQAPLRLMVTMRKWRKMKSSRPLDEDTERVHALSLAENFNMQAVRLIISDPASIFVPQPLHEDLKDAVLRVVIKRPEDDAPVSSASDTAASALNSTRDASQAATAAASSSASTPASSIPPFTPTDTPVTPSVKPPEIPPATVQHAEARDLQGEAFIFEKGSIVCWNMKEEDIQSLCALLTNESSTPYKENMIDDQLEVMSCRLVHNQKTQLKNGHINLSSIRDDLHEDVVQHSHALERFAFSHALERSVKLGIYEAELRAYAHRVAYISEDIRSGRPLKLSQRECLILLGELLSLRNKINSASDLANFYWDRSDLEPLYIQTLDYLDIEPRQNMANQRLTYHAEEAELMRTTLAENHAVKLEWYVIGLISVEVFFELLHFLPTVLK